MRLYGTSILLFVCAIWLALFGDGTFWGVIVLALLGAAVTVQVREQHRLHSQRHRRHRGR